MDALIHSGQACYYLHICAKNTPCQRSKQTYTTADVCGDLLNALWQILTSLVPPISVTYRDILRWGRVGDGLLLSLVIVTK